MDPRRPRPAIGKLGVALAMLLVTGCSVMQPPSPPRIETPPVASEPPPVVEPVVAAPSRPAPAPAPPPPPGGAEPRIEALPSGAPNLPYVVNGERYVPANSDVEMNEIGTASWYGKPFHGRRTANGELYDMHAMTAAHKTMPLPSYALVRNRTNGKEIVVRINDRGPFKPGRVIDLSYAAARAIGITGLGNVEVIRLTREAIRLGWWRIKGKLGMTTVASADEPPVKR